MPTSKRRPSTRSPTKRKITKNGTGNGKVSSKRRYWFRGDPCTRQRFAPVPFKVTPLKRRPVLPHVIHADRLIPFRPRGTLGERANRQWALQQLRKRLEKNKGDPSSKYYTTALQGEILKAPLRVRTESDRAILEALPNRWFMNFSMTVNQKESLSDALATHPLEHGQLSRAFSKNKHLFKSDRTIVKVPYKILDAPDLKDDFYYNLIDWSSKDVLSVGLGRAVYLWNATNSDVDELNGSSEERDEVSAVGWSQGASALAIGGRQGKLQLWDPETKTKIISLRGHTNRVGSLSWNRNILASGCRDGNIRHYDHRQSNPVLVLKGHRSEVCGVKWSMDDVHLASGGNDNFVNVWDIRRPEKEIWRIKEHTAAVKALSWSPHHSKHFVSGGGLKDLGIKVWNLNTMECMASVNADAQVCGLHWSENVDEIVSAHGYNSNCLQLWKASDLEYIGSVTGHTTRIVYLATSPDGQSIATGSGDETIRFFKIFPSSNYKSIPSRTPRTKINTTAR